MSLVLFSLFEEDLELLLQDNLNTGLKIEEIILLLLLFADDMVILGKTSQELQMHLNSVKVRV